MHLGFNSAMQTHSWKNCFKKLKENKTNLPFLSQSGLTLMRHHYCKSCVGWWNPWINLEMGALYWSQAGPGRLQHHGHQRSEGSNSSLGWCEWQLQVVTILFSLTNTCTPPDTQPSATGKTSGSNKGQKPPEGPWSTHRLQGTGMWTGYSSMEGPRALK